MTDVRLNCKNLQLYIHCLHLQSITAFGASQQEGSSLPPSSAIPSSWTLKAYTILHIHFSPLMWSGVVSSNMIYLNSSSNIWGASGWSPVRSWILPCYRNGLVLIPGIVTAFLLAGIIHTDLPVVSSMLWTPCLQTKWRQHHKFLSTEILQSCALYSLTEQNLCFDPCPHCPTPLPTPSLLLGSWQSLSFSPSLIHSSIVA